MSSDSEDEILFANIYNDDEPQLNKNRAQIANDGSLPTPPEEKGPDATADPDAANLEVGTGENDPAKQEAKGLYTGNIYIPPKDEGKMFIGGLNWDTTDESLKKYFEQFGEVLECNVMRDTATGRSRGFGFLSFAAAESVNKVLEKEHILDGKMIDPKRAIPREEQDKTAKIFVGGVGNDVTDSDFEKFFQQYGVVIDAQLMIDKDTGKPRGFGFVTFDSDQAVEKIVADQFLLLKGKPIEVKRAEPRSKGDAAKDGAAGGAGGVAAEMAPQYKYANQMTPALMSQYYQQWQKYMHEVAQAQAEGASEEAVAAIKQIAQQMQDQLRAASMKSETGGYHRDNAGHGGSGFSSYRDRGGYRDRDYGHSRGDRDRDREGYHGQNNSYYNSRYGGGRGGRNDARNDGAGQDGQVHEDFYNDDADSRHVEDERTRGHSNFRSRNRDRGHRRGGGGGGGGAGGSGGGAGGDRRRGGDMDRDRYRSGRYSRDRHFDRGGGSERGDRGGGSERGDRDGSHPPNNNATNTNEKERRRSRSPRGRSRHYR